MHWYQYALITWLITALGFSYHPLIGKKNDPPPGNFSEGLSLQHNERANGIPEDKGSGKTVADFQLYTRRNRDDGESIHVGRINVLKDSKFVPSIPTKIIIHGFLASAKTEYILDIKEGYLNASNVNVIMVDWSRLAARTYLRSVSHVTKVGRYVAQFVTFLAAQKGGEQSGAKDNGPAQKVANEEGAKRESKTLARFHIIGHSLGAHAAGAAGAALRESGGLVGRITGLDPASPLFSARGPTSRLDPTDAAFVDVVHTCGGELGYRQPCGHVDFYPNGGKDPQPGCQASKNVYFEKEACSHRRAVEFFTESLTSEYGFPALRCESWPSFQRGTCNATDDRVVYMGDSDGKHRIDLRARGTFYLKTADSFPFSEPS